LKAGRKPAIYRPRYLLCSFQYAVDIALKAANRGAGQAPQCVSEKGMGVFLQ